MMRTQLTQSPASAGEPITIRRATPADAVALQRLAQLDSALSLTGEILLAECGARVVAAIELADGSTIADPFRRTADITRMLGMWRRGLIGHPSKAAHRQIGIRFAERVRHPRPVARSI